VLGQAIRVAGHLDRRDFTVPNQRSPGACGVVTGRSDGHGLCFEVRHEDGTVAWYDPDELTVLDGGPKTWYERLGEV
jgi:hypothetical protein